MVNAFDASPVHRTPVCRNLFHSSQDFSVPPPVIFHSYNYYHALESHLIKYCEVLDESSLSNEKGNRVYFYATDTFGSCGWFSDKRITPRRFINLIPQKKNITDDESLYVHRFLIGYPVGAPVTVHSLNILGHRVCSDLAYVILAHSPGRWIIPPVSCDRSDLFLFFELSWDLTSWERINSLRVFGLRPPGLLSFELMLLKRDPEKKSVLTPRSEFESESSAWQADMMGRYTTWAPVFLQVIPPPGVEPGTSR
jgi:hypothetical protein